MHLPNWYAAHCHEPFDLDAELKDIADSDHEQNSLRVVALLSIGLPVEEAFLRCRELLETVQWAASDHPDGKRRLAALLGAAEHDYQRALYYALAGRGAIAMLSTLKRLTDILESRYLLCVAAPQQSVDLRLPDNPYLTDKADGPQGVFKADYELSELWGDICH